MSDLKHYYKTLLTLLTYMSESKTLLFINYKTLLLIIIINKAVIGMNH